MYHVVILYNSLIPQHGPWFARQ